jgi:putative transposase
MKANDAKELKRLKDENLRLKRMVADQALDIEMLKEVARDALIDCQAAINA